MTETAPYRLKDTHALVTGGGSGIGAAIAAMLDRAQVRVSLLGRTKSSLETTQASMKHKAGIAVGNITDADAVRNAVSELVSAHGPVRILINNAGAAESAAFDQTDHRLWQYMIETNLTGTFNVIQAVLGDLKAAGGGRIVNIASTAGLKGYAYVSAYTAAKHGVIGLTRALALELAGAAITVNAVCPGFTETPLLERSLGTIAEKTGLSETDARKQLNKVNPMNRFIEPDEVAAAALWLCQENAAAITGEAIAVDGGELA